MLCSIEKSLAVNFECSGDGFRIADDVLWIVYEILFLLVGEYFPIFYFAFLELFWFSWIVMLVVLGIGGRGYLNIDGLFAISAGCCVLL